MRWRPRAGREGSPGRRRRRARIAGRCRARGRPGRRRPPRSGWCPRVRGRPRSRALARPWVRGALDAAGGVAGHLAESGLPVAAELSGLAFDAVAVHGESPEVEVGLSPSRLVRSRRLAGLFAPGMERAIGWASVTTRAARLRGARGRVRAEAFHIVGEELGALTRPSALRGMGGEPRWASCSEARLGWRAGRA